MKPVRFTSITSSTKCTSDEARDNSFGMTSTATRTPARRAAAYAIYFAAIGTLVYFTRSRFDGRLYAFAVLFFGALHILYDGFVWKLRRPAVAASLGITST